MIDPTYNQEEIAANPEWQIAFSLSEMMDDEAPIGWSKYIFAARGLLANYDIKRKQPPNNPNEGELLQPDSLGLGEPE